MVRTRLLAALAIFATLAAGLPARAQGGKIDPDQEVDHFRAFGPFEVICDVVKAKQERRCYLRVVDVYVPRPLLEAAILFVTVRAGGGGPSFRFSLEPGAVWSAPALSVDRPGVKPVSLGAPCVAPVCEISGGDATALARALVESAEPGAGLVLDFRGKLGIPRRLVWSIADFAAAWTDFDAARRERGLP